MEIGERLASLATKAPPQKATSQSGKSTKTAFVAPSISLTLRYGASKRKEVTPEGTPDIGIKSGEKKATVPVLDKRRCLLAESQGKQCGHVD